MSYTVANPGSRSRPTTVTAASAMLYVAGAIQLISIVPALLAFGPISEVVDQELANTPEAGAVATTMRVGIVVGVIIALLFGIGTIVVGVLDSRGKNPARIVTWVLGGIVLLCSICGLVLQSASDSLANMGGAPNDPQSAEVQRRIEEAIPSWQNAFETVSSVLTILLFAGAMILLALRPSNEFFRKEQEVWVPPTYPGGPPVGGPPAGGPPPGQYPPPPGQYPPPAGGPPPGQYPPPPGQYPPPEQPPPPQYGPPPQ